MNGSWALERLEFTWLWRETLARNPCLNTAINSTPSRAFRSIPASDRIPLLIHEMTLAGSSYFSPSKLEIHWNTWIIELEYCGWSSSLTLRAQFGEHKSIVDLGSNLSGTPPKLYFIQYFGEKNGTNRMVLSCSIFVKAEYKKPDSGAHLQIQMDCSFMCFWVEKRRWQRFWTKWYCGYPI